MPKPTESTAEPDSRRSVSEAEAEPELSAITKSLSNALNDSADASVKLGLFWDEWARCVGSGYQSDSLYRHGRLDTCGKQWRDLKLAVEARVVQWRDPVRAKKLIDSTYYKKRTTISPTAGAIWELKEQPGWN